MRLEFLFVVVLLAGCQKEEFLPMPKPIKGTAYEPIKILQNKDKNNESASQPPEANPNQKKN